MQLKAPEPKLGKTMESHTNLLFHREIIRKKKENHTAAIYNST